MAAKERCLARDRASLAATSRHHGRQQAGKHERGTDQASPITANRTYLASSVVEIEPCVRTLELLQQGRTSNFSC